MHFILNKSSKTCLLYIRIDKKGMIILRLIKKSMKSFCVFGKKNAVFTLILDTMGLDIRPFPPFLASASSRASIASTSMGWCCKKLMTSYNVFPSLGGYHYLRHGGVSEISSRGFSRPPYRKPNISDPPLSNKFVCDRHLKDFPLKNLK